MGFHFLVGAGLDRCRKCRATKTWAVLEPHSLRAVSADAFIARAQAVYWGGEPE